MRRYIFSFLFLPFSLIGLAQKPALTLPISFNGIIMEAAFHPDGNTILTVPYVNNTVKVWDKRTAKLLFDLRGHTGTVKTAIYSPGGDLIITSSDDGTVKIWDARSGKMLHDLRGHTEPIHDLVLSADGRRVMSACEESMNVWDVRTGKLLSSVRQSDPGISSASMTRDGTKTILFENSNMIQVRLAESGKLLLTIKADEDPDNWISGGPLFPDDTKVVSVFDDVISVWDIRTGKLFARFREAGEEVDEVSFSPDGSKLLYSLRNFSLRLLEFPSGKPLAKMVGHEVPPNIVCFSPDGSKILTSSEEGRVFLWDGRNGRQLHSLHQPGLFILYAAFNREGTQLILAQENSTVTIWDVETGRQEQTITGRTEVFESVAFSRDGRLITISSNENVQFWNLSDGRLQLNVRGAKQGFRNTCFPFFSRDSSIFIVSGANHEANIYRFSTGKLISVLKGHKESIDELCFSPDESKIITSSDAGVIKVWEVLTGKQLFELSGHTGRVWELKVSADGSKVISRSRDNTAKLWDLRTGKLLLDITGYKKTLEHVLLSPDGKSLLTVNDEDNAPTLWDIRTKQRIVTMKGHTDYVRFCLYTPSGDRIVTGSFDKTVKIWDARTGNLIYDLRKHTDRLTDAAFIANGSRVITRSEGDELLIWELSTGKLLAEGKGEKLVFSPQRDKFASFSRDRNTGTVWIWDAMKGKLLSSLIGHTAQIEAVRFSPTGITIATTSSDNTAKVWDVRTGNLLFDLRGHTDVVSDVAYSSDEKKLATASWDATTRIWDLATGELLYSQIAVDSTDYLVLDKNYRFDGTEGARKLLYFTCGSEIVELDQLKDQLWVPNLARRIIKGETINSKILSDINLCGSTPVVQEMNTSKGSYRFLIRPRSGGLGQTALFVNGIEVKRFEPAQLTKQAGGYELLITRAELSKNFVVGMDNTVAVRAYTADNSIYARGLKVEENSSGDRTSAAPNLYAVMVGVSDYKGDELDLKYAAKDAKDLANVLKIAGRKMLNIDGKEHVFIYDLTTSQERMQLPEKNGIRKTLEEIGQKAQPNDILLIFFAGHGVMEGDKKQFYFLTADASVATATTAIKEVGISTEELTEWMKPQNIRAQKRILIFDACNSGQAIKDFVKIGGGDQGYLAARSDEQGQLIKAIDRLNERSGLFILSAAASDQSAYEMGRYSQGLLTYSLLRAIKQQPDILEQGKYLDLSRWFRAAEQTVIELTRENGARQQPQLISNTNFSIGIVDEEVRARISFPQEKPQFAGSNLQNADPDIASDDLGLNRLLNDQMQMISARGSDVGIVFAPGQLSPDSWTLGGRYEVKGKSISARLNLRKGSDPAKYKFDFTGTIDDLSALAKRLAEKAVSLVQADSNR